MNAGQYNLTLISISYNNFENIKKHIESIMVQDYEDYELIFQDDGSDNYNADRIKELIPNSFIKKHNVRFYHSKKNAGTVKNLNAGIAKANGKIVMPMAVDDYLSDSHVFSRFIKEFEDESCNICCCSIIQERSRKVLPSKRDIDIIKNGSQRELLDRIYASNCIIGALLTIRKDFFVEKKLFDTRFILVEDYPTFLQLIRDGERIRFISEVCLIHGENGISNRFSTLLNRNKTAARDAKLIKDIYVLPYLNDVRNKNIRRYIVACYYLRFHKNILQLTIKLCQYSDVWIKVALYYILRSKSDQDIYYYLSEDW